ncbi:MAG: hypothetical protein ABFS22_13415 [Pseudomonadota bacterium]
MVDAQATTSGKTVAVSMGRLAIAVLVFAIPLTVQAHGFAQRYDLPVPLALYVTGAAAAVALSFVVIAFFVRGKRTVASYPRYNLLATPVGHLLASKLTIALLRLISSGLLILVIIAGLVGNTNPFRNIAPTTVWVIWWVGLAYVSGLFGNLWALINPWKTIYELAERIVKRLQRDARPGLCLAYPKWLGDWPAVLLFICFVWAELVWPSSDVPASLATAVITYSLITWSGMFIFGKHIWLRHGEAFSLVFGFLARFAPSEVRVNNDTVCADCSAADCRHSHVDCVNCHECFEKATANVREWNLRPWAVGLLTGKPIKVSSMVLVLVILSSVTFDGLLATPLWGKVAQWMLLSEDLRPLVLLLQDVSGNAIAAVSTIALVAFLVMFQILYLLFSALMYISTPSQARTGVSILEVARLFVLSLIPISLAYHLAHYLSFLLIVGQYMIPLASDPFGMGRDLFGTSLYMVNIGIVNARFVWITSVIAIVMGHIVAVYLAHVMALRTFRNSHAALRSQIPMLFLMVGYTMLSLWILAQPIVET